MFLKAVQRIYVKKMPMKELTHIERERLLDAAKKIHAHKLMHAKGFDILAKKAEDERIKQLLLRISGDEAGHAEFWLEKIKELGSKRHGATKTFLRDWKVGFMMRILGTKGFFEWIVVGEREGIQSLAIQAEKIREKTSSETWRRLASDERMHLERMTTEVLGMEAWEIRGGGGVRDMIFGANDGLVSTLAFVAGVAGALTDPSIVLLSGVAELFAGTISMAVGSYQSSKSELEVLERESQREKTKRGKTPEEERQGLIRFYESEGFKRAEAEAIVDRIVAKEKALPLQTTAIEQLGLAPEELGSPVKAGVLCGASFGLAALVPILPFVLPIGIWEALIASAIGTVATLFGVGAMKTIFSRKNWVRSGLEMMAIGTFAAAITYVIGTLFSLVV
jgi:VIT1/CCC1 family predicted Fe2+/Mn2+ transporter/rubrerythrin